MKTFTLDDVLECDMCNDYYPKLIKWLWSRYCGESNVATVFDILDSIIPDIDKLYLVFSLRILSHNVMDRWRAAVLFKVAGMSSHETGNLLRAYAKELVNYANGNQCWLLATLSPIFDRELHYDDDLFALRCATCPDTKDVVLYSVKVFDFSDHYNAWMVHALSVLVNKYEADWLVKDVLASGNFDDNDRYMAIKALEAGIDTNAIRLLASGNPRRPESVVRALRMLVEGARKK
ncbi:hypothetical protein GF380_02575 [Candidatus Uhrbacteria bacterium]|nr:hypothetical protein [Candidatus Uhrbacteria bacterium]